MFVVSRPVKPVKPVRTTPATYHTIALAAGTTTVTLALNPQITIETTWGIDRSSAVVRRYSVF